MTMYKDNVLSLLNLNWPQSNNVNVDLSVRDIIAKRLQNNLMSKYFMPLSEITDKRDLYRYFEKDTSLVEKFNKIINQTVQDFVLYIKKFGNYNCLFINALLNANIQDDKLRYACENLILWYYDDYKKESSVICGNVVGANFPYDEFISVISNVSMSFVLSAIYDGGKVGLSKIIEKFKGGKYYPRSIIKLVGENETEDVVRKELSFLYKKKLLIFDLTIEEINTIEEICIESLKSILDLSYPEIKILSSIIEDSPYTYNESIISKFKKLNILSIIEYEKGVVQPAIFTKFNL